MMSHDVVGLRSCSASRDAKGRGRSGGFSLLELLIVIGIIALLITGLVTAVSKVRSAAKRTQCLSNLRSIGAAMHQYIADNNDAFPLAASNKGHKDGDFLYWQSTVASAGTLFSIDLVGAGGVGKYIGSVDDLTPGGLISLRCPADERLELNGFLGTTPQQTAAHTPYPAGYPFSYVINAFMVSGNYPDLSPDPSTIARTFTKVKDASAKIMVYEEDYRTINDGVGILSPNNELTNLLSVRHDIHEPLSQITNSIPPDPDAKIVATVGAPVPPSNYPSLTQINHMNASGNVLFADGHAESVTRAFAHIKAHYAPDPDAPLLAALP